MMNENLNFGDAIKALKEGKKVARKGWNGKNMYLWLKPAVTIKAEWCKDPMLKEIVDANGGEAEALGTICMKTADNKILTGWLASQTDMLSEDWAIVLSEDCPIVVEKENVNVNYVGSTIVQVDEDDFDDFFVDFDSNKEYQDIVGKCFINNRIGEAVKVLLVTDLDPAKFIYEKFIKEEFGGWNVEDYIWLQEQDKPRYEKHKITPYANMNIGSENMFHLGKNGKLYTTVECGDEWYEYHEISNEEFEKIREEAINNLEE
jgi:hypothetical protein